MNIEEQIAEYIGRLPEPKRNDMTRIHSLMGQWFPHCKLWYFDGKNEADKRVSNPTIGYGGYTITYANGKTREFFRIGLSANTKGISMYLMDLEDKKYLIDTYGASLGKASLTGYCIRFKSLEDVNLDALETAIRDGLSDRQR